MPTSVKLETRSFSLHPQAIHTFIKAQAGSLAKALSEAVMNSIDAYATSVSITVTSKGFVIEDDGQGFRSKDEIAAWFETLGFPHDEGNHRTYGTFGMGRAQMWAYARTDWTSNEFQMDVDVKKNGLDYDLKLTDKPFKGTKIVGTFYKAMDNWELVRLRQETESLIQYVPGIVSYNGERINLDPSLEDWEIESAEAYLRSGDAKQGLLTVYNGGVLVASFRKHRFGITGVVVTKPTATLRLNLARNDILPDCPVWAVIKGTAKSLACNKEKKQSLKPVGPSQATLRDAIKSVVAGDLTIIDALAKYPGLLVNTLGRTLSLHSLFNYQKLPVTVAPKGNLAARKANTLKIAVVLSSTCIKLFEDNGISFEDLFARIKSELVASGLSNLRVSACQVEASVKARTPIEWSRDFERICGEVLSEKTIYLKKDLTTDEQAAQAALLYTWKIVRNAIASKYGYQQPERKALDMYRTVALGDSPTDVCWLGGHVKVVYRKKELMHTVSTSKPGAQAMVVAQLIKAAMTILYPDDPAKQAQEYMRWTIETPIAGKGFLALNSNVVANHVKAGRTAPKEILTLLSDNVETVESDEESAEEEATS